MNPSLPKSILNLPALSTMYRSTYRYLYILCDHRAFMSPESCYSWQTAPHASLWLLRPYQPRACFLLYSLRVDPFLQWPAFKSFRSTRYFQLGKILLPPFLGNARSGPSPSRWPALITLPNLAKYSLVGRRLCDVVLFLSCIVEHTLTAICVLLSRRSPTHQSGQGL